MVGGCFVYLRMLVLPVLLYLTVLGAVFSGSEIAAGGNYNLHFLSAQARRALSPSGEESRVPPLGNHSIPRHSIVPYVPVSLYMPEAGFLWQDDAVWIPQLGVFGDQSELEAGETERAETDAAASSSPDEPDSSLYRVHFSDPIGQRHPWAFEQEQANGVELEDEWEEHQKDYLHSHLWSGEMVSLRSRVTGSYLGVAGGQRSLIDTELNVEVSPDDFRRLRVRYVIKPAPPLDMPWPLVS